MCVAQKKNFLHRIGNYILGNIYWRKTSCNSIATLPHAELTTNNTQNSIRKEVLLPLELGLQSYYTSSIVGKSPGGVLGVCMHGAGYNYMIVILLDIAHKYHPGVEPTVMYMTFWLLIAIHECRSLILADSILYSCMHGRGYTCDHSIYIGQTLSLSLSLSLVLFLA